MSDPRIEDRLTDLASRLEWPDDADLAPAVTRRLQEASPGPRRTVLLGVAATVVSLVVVITLIPAGRQAVADLLGVAGIEIEFGSEATPPPVGTLNLGDPVSLAEAREAATFPLLLPTHPDLGEPDTVHLDGEDPVGVTLGWLGDHELPAAGGAGIALLHTQFRAVGRVLIQKDLGSDTSLVQVRVRNREGRWIEGAPHDVEVRSGDGTSSVWEMRLGANVLIWEEDGVTHRIETTLNLEDTLEIADSLRSLPG